MVTHRSNWACPNCHAKFPGYTDEVYIENAKKFLEFLRETSPIFNDKFSSVRHRWDAATTIDYSLCVKCGGFFFRPRIMGQPSRFD